jgi:shikimate 5-dehydrogenase
MVWRATHSERPAPTEPPRLAACLARGLRVQRGLPMLVHQAVLSFGLFTGVSVAPDDVSAGLR